MVAQIPLTWQLTDFLSAMGLGFLYGGFYCLLRALCPAKRQGRFVLDFFWGAVCVFFTRAWVLTASHAAQVRFGIAAGAAAGTAAFAYFARPVLRRLRQRLLRPVRRLERKARLWAGALCAARQRRREIRRQKTAGRRRRPGGGTRQRRAGPHAERGKKDGVRQKSRISKTDTKKVQENAQKELQTNRHVYYNNLY